MMYKWISIILSGLALFSMGKAGMAFAEDAGGRYSIHPPRLSVPDGKPGEIRRSLMQFYGWTLICDEMLERKQMICNVTQAVVDSSGKEVFSWSLVAADDGSPFLLLRAPANVNKKVPVKLDFKSGGQPIKIPFVECDANVCLAQTPVDFVLTKAIEKEMTVKISFQTHDKKTIGFDLSFAGLKQAVAAIR